jgi:hypothetical protein
VATLHRPFNVDSTEAAALLVKAMHQVADMAPVIMPVHPRGRAMIEAAGLAEHPGIRMCEPLGYLTLRPVTERPVTVDQVISFARRLDPGLEERDFADAGRRLDRWGDAIFAPYGLGPAEAAALRAAFAGWPR